MTLALLCFAAHAAPSDGPTVVDAGGPIVVDGVLDEAGWADAEPVVAFLRFQPVEGGAPPGTTEVRFLQDDKYLYVGISVRDSGYPIRARISPREAINQDDQVGVYLDTWRDGRSGYIFYFNPLGIQQDIRHSAGSWNPSWDTAFRSRGRVVDGDGFDIEIAYPWRSIRYPRGEGPQEWGVVLTRKIPREGAKYGYPVLERNHPRVFSQAAPLRGVRPGNRGSGLELIPSVTAGQVWPRDDEPKWSGADPVGEVVRPSLDLRYALTPDIGLTAALNPDFSQVEADALDVRLDPRFARNLPETRPFFLDGSDFYGDRMGTLHSRSIVEPIYGLKVSGRQGPVSVGVLSALDRSPGASFHEQGAPGFDTEDVADRWAHSSMLRIRGDAFGTGSVGLTFADKRITASPARTGQGGTFDALGADTAVPMGQRWFAGGSLLASRVVDGRESVWGTETSASVNRAGGLGWGANLSVSHVTPGLRQEMGFLNQSGTTSGSASAAYTFEPEGVVDTFTPGLATSHFYENDGDYSRVVEAEQDLVLGGIHALDTEVGWRQWRQSGLPQPFEMAGAFVNAGYNAQLAKAIQVSPAVGATRVLDFGTLAPATAISASGAVSLWPSIATRFDLSGSWQRRTILLSDIDPSLRLPVYAADIPFTPAGRVLRTGWRVRNRFTWQFTRTLGLRLIDEVATVDRDATFLNSVLLTWLREPGTAAYLGYTERSDIRERQALERVIFAKVSVLLRP